MSNNDILKKLRVALKLKNDDIQKILLLANFNVSISELNAFFRFNGDKCSEPKRVSCRS